MLLTILKLRHASESFMDFRITNNLCIERYLSVTLFSCYREGKEGVWLESLEPLHA